MGALLMNLFIAVSLIGLLGSTGAALLAVRVKSLERFLDYGKSRGSRNSGAKRRSLADTVDEITVPRRWFSHFYIELVTLISIRVLLKRNWNIRDALLFIQGARRLHEELFVFRCAKTSRMHFSHYLVGLFFYTVQSFAKIKLNDRLITPSVSLFVAASLAQHICHRSLAATPKYQYPRFPILGSERCPFLLTACPHYGFEILIYFALSLLARPSLRDGGFLLSIASLQWVVVSLCISGNRSRHYYSSLHGKSASSERKDFPQLRWSVLPFFY